MSLIKLYLVKCWSGYPFLIAKIYCFFHWISNTCIFVLSMNRSLKVNFTAVRITQCFSCLPKKNSTHTCTQWHTKIPRRHSPVISSDRFGVQVDTAMFKLEQALRRMTKQNLFHLYLLSYNLKGKQRLYSNKKRKK